MKITEIIAKKFKKGEKVILPANKKAGWPEERGTVAEVEDKDMYIVDLDRSYVKPGDDGMREVHVSGMKKIPIKEGKVDRRDTMPFGTDSKNAAKKVLAILKDKSNYKTGASGDNWSIKPREIKSPSSPSAIVVYNADRPLIDFFFFTDSNWFDKMGVKKTPTEVIKDIRMYDMYEKEPGWAEIIFKPKAIKLLMSGAK